MENKIASRIYELRKQINLSQSELAKNIGASQKAIDFWEKGINEPKASYIISFAKFFDVSTDFLLGLED